MPLLVPCLLVLAAATALDDSPAYLDQAALLRRCNELASATPTAAGATRWD